MARTSVNQPRTGISLPSRAEAEQILGLGLDLKYRRTEHVNSHVYRDMLTVMYVRSCHVYLHIPMLRLLTVTCMETRPIRLL